MTVCVDERTGEAATISVAIQDSGAGISAEGQKRLFQDYSQVDARADRAAMGTGLGLSISRGLAELMGGSISVRSEEGCGSKFRFQFQPAVVAASSGGGAVLQESELTGQRILVVDDNASNRFVVRAFLKKSGAIVAEIDSGAGALMCAAEMKFDVILMDMHMPNMGGMETFRSIRNGSSLSAGAAIIALTGDSADEDREAIFDAGMDGYLTKPLSKGDLYTELARHVVPLGVDPQLEPAVPLPQRKSAPP